jgi:uncharacterized protein
MPGHGTVLWNELNTHDAEKAKRFYGTTLGWTYEAMPMPQGGTYWLFKAGDATAGGIFTLEGPMFANVPDHWLPYIEVDNVDQRVAKVAAAGGAVMRDPFDIPGVGRIAIVKDATGAVVGWMTPSPQMK